jgi:phosphatidylserine decarboxylase
MTDLLLGGALAVATGIPLAWKWELGLQRAVPALVVTAAVAAAFVGLVGADGVLAVAATWALAMALAVATVLWRFFRDPERAAPAGAGVVVSPADGQVIYVKRSEGGEVPVSEKVGRTYPLHELVQTPLNHQESWVVGIALSFLDVHVNRAPIAGLVASQRRFPGRFASLKDPSAVLVNERATTVVERPGLQVAIVLIASRLVRRIVSYVEIGDNVDLGQRIGMIRFGSQVDVVLPHRDDMSLAVEQGQRVRAGETVIATFGTEGE